jgi:hypothetical protein
VQNLQNGLKNWFTFLPIEQLTLQINLERESRIEKTFGDFSHILKNSEMLNLKKPQIS